MHTLKQVYYGKETTSFTFGNCCPLPNGEQSIVQLPQKCIPIKIITTSHKVIIFCKSHPFSWQLVDNKQSKAIKKSDITQTP